MSIPFLYLYENPRRCGFSDFHLLLWAASANHHGLPMAVIFIFSIYGEGAWQMRFSHQ